MKQLPEILLRPRRAFALAIMVPILVSGSFLPVSADENESPIPKLLVEEIAAGADPVYSLTRCGGLYLSIFEWAGPSRLGEANSEGIRNAVVALNALATNAMVQSDDIDAASASDKADQEIRAHANVYIKHFQAVSSVVGKAFMSDNLIQNDGATCQTLLAG